MYRNTLSIAMLQHLIQEIQIAADDSSLKSIVLCGNGPIFSAGHNLNELVSDFCYSKMHKNIKWQYLYSRLDISVESVIINFGCNLKR